MRTNCVPRLADIFLYSYEAEFIQSLLSVGRKRSTSQFNFTYRYIDDVLPIYNPDFENYLGQMYPHELEIKDSTESNTSASYLDLLLSIHRDGQLSTSLFDKRDDFNFHIKLSVHPIFSRLWRYYLTTHPIRQGLLFLWMFYSEDSVTFR